MIHQPEEKRSVTAGCSCPHQLAMQNGGAAAFVVEDQPVLPSNRRGCSTLCGLARHISSKHDALFALATLAWQTRLLLGSGGHPRRTAAIQERPSWRSEVQRSVTACCSCRYHVALENGGSDVSVVERQPVQPYDRRGSSAL